MNSADLVSLKRMRRRPQTQQSSGPTLLPGARHSEKIRVSGCCGGSPAGVVQPHVAAMRRRSARPMYDAQLPALGALFFDISTSYRSSPRGGPQVELSYQYLGIRADDVFKDMRSEKHRRFWQVQKGRRGAVEVPTPAELRRGDAQRRSRGWSGSARRRQQGVGECGDW